MNSGISNKIMTRSLQHQFYRYLSIKQNVNKSTCAYHKLKNEDRSSNFSLTRTFSQKHLCQFQTPVYTNFHRHISNETIQAKNLVLAKETVKPIEIVSQDTGVSIETIISETSDNMFVQHVLESLAQLRESTGLPWWMVIAINAFVFRTCVVLPFAVNQLRVLTKLEKIELEMNEKVKNAKIDVVKAKKQFDWPDDIAEQRLEDTMYHQYQDALKRENVHPTKSYFLISVQTGTWVTITFSTWLLCVPQISGEKVYNEMLTGGFGWITNLTETDPYFVLPLAIALVNLAIIEVHQMFKVSRRSSKEQWKVIFFRLLSIGLIPVAAHTPAAVNIYWLSSSLYGIIQAFLLNSSTMRRLFRVPTLDPALKKPYRYFFNNLKSRLRPSKNIM